MFYPLPTVRGGHVKTTKGLTDMSKFATLKQASGVTPLFSVAHFCKSRVAPTGAFPPVTAFFRCPGRRRRDGDGLKIIQVFYRQKANAQSFKEMN